MPYKDPTKKKDHNAKYRAENIEQITEQQTRYYEDLKQHAIDSIASGKITNRNKMGRWIKEIKKKAKKYPYSIDFTNEMIFEMLTKGCYYCGQLATSVDRIDSTRDHTPDNCVASCYPCNFSKGVSDSATFIRKAYYRARGEYVDDIIDIWVVNKTKPCMYQYKKRAEKQGVPFDLTKKEFEDLVAGDCEYCRRTSISWFGVDRVIPENGYVSGNVVSCCFDCNIDKYKDDVDTMMRRNERISERVDTGGLVIEDREKVILHKGICKTSKKVSAYGKVYTSFKEASRALGKGDDYVRDCIRNGRYKDEIFIVSK